MIFSLGGLNRGAETSNDGRRQSLVGAETSNDGRRQSLVHRLPEPPIFFGG